MEAEKARAPGGTLSTEPDFDSLTGLVNRAELLRRLANLWLPYGARRTAPLGVLLFDIDRFHLVNEQFGSVAGDEVLATIAHRMRIRARRGDLVARYGSDRFVIVLGRVAGPREAQGASDRFRLAQLEPIAVGTQWVSASLSSGVAVARQGEHPHATLERAERDLLASRGRCRP